MSFVNPYQPKDRRRWLDFLRWMFGLYNDPYPPPPIPEGFFFPNPVIKIDAGAPKVTWINHSTFLCEVGGRVFLTDPIWNERCSPFSFIGPKRHHRPPIELEALPKVDFVIISHNHYDHLDYKTIQKLLNQFPEVRFVVPKGVKKWFLKRFASLKKEAVVELVWGESYRCEDVVFHAVAAQHFSGRGIRDHDRTLWMGCVIEIGGKCLYFAGDTGYNRHDFKKIGQRWKEIDLSLIPIGAYIPRGFMAPVHINPEEAVKIHQEVGSRLSVACHFGTFKLSSESFEQPLFDLYTALEREGISWERFRVLQPGQTLNW